MQSNANQVLMKSEALRQSAHQLREVRRVRYEPTSLQAVLVLRAIERRMTESPARKCEVLVFEDLSALNDPIIVL